MKNGLIGAIVVVVLGVLFFGFTKVRTWMGVSSTAATESIEDALGKHKVLQAEARAQLADLKKSTKAMQEGRIRCQVRAEQLATKLKDLDTQKVTLTSDLKRLRDLMTAEQPVALGGRSYSKGELQGATDKKVAAFKAIDAQRATLERARGAIDRRVADFLKREEQSSQMIAAMESRMTEVETELVALETLRKAATDAGGDPKDLAESFAEEQKKVDKLQGEVTTQLRLADERWNDVGPAADPSVDALLRETKDVQTSVDEIDKLLGHETPKGPAA